MLIQYSSSTFPDDKLNEQCLWQNGTTALMCACESGQSAAARALLAAGADAGACDADGWTPLAFAARGGHLPIVKDLLDAGARVDLRDCVSKTCLYSSYTNGICWTESETAYKKTTNTVTACTQACSSLFTGWKLTTPCSSFSVAPTALDLLIMLVSEECIMTCSLNWNVLIQKG